MISSSTLITASADVVTCELETGRALLDLRTGSYFSLNEAGNFVWRLLDTPKSYNDIFQAMSDHYDVDSETLNNDLKGLVSRLVEQGLIVNEG